MTRPQQARQPLRPAIAGQQPQPDFGLSETRGRLGNAIVTGERKFHAAAQRDALHGRNARLAHRFNLAKRKLRIVGQHHRFIKRMDFLEHLANVGTRDERRRALAGKHDRGHIVLTRQVIDHDHKLIDRAFVQRVHRRIGDGNRCDPLARCDDIILDQEIAITVEQRLVFGQPLLALPVVDYCLEFGQRLRIAQRRHITNVATINQRAHHAAHIFARPRFGKCRHFEEVGRDRDRPFFGPDKVKQAAAVILRQLAPRNRHNKRKRGKPLFTVRRAYDKDIADGGVRIERLVAQDRTFDFFGAHPVARHVDDVVTAPMK